MGYPQKFRLIAPHGGTLINRVLSGDALAEKQEQALKDQQRELRELTTFVQRLAFELERTNDKLDGAADREASEREKLLLKVENYLLKARRQLPPARQPGRLALRWVGQRLADSRAGCWAACCADARRAGIALGRAGGLLWRVARVRAVQHLF